MAFRGAELDALVFDLGNVLLPIDFGRAFASWGEAAGIPASTLEQRFSFDEAYCAHERGELDASGYFARLRGTLGVALSDAQLLRMRAACQRDQDANPQSGHDDLLVPGNLYPMLRT